MRTLLRTAVLAAVGSLVVGAVQAAPVVTPYVNGLAGGTGAAYHSTSQYVYYLEATAGKMSKVNTANGVVTTIQTGLVHPDDLALFPASNIGYVTTRTGELWKVSTVSNARTLVTSGLGLPLEIVLDPGNFQAYTVDYATGTLWRVELAGGAKVA